MAAQRLSSLDWLQAGFRGLTAGGANAVRAEPLARGLGVSKGSFYHHFKDLPDFHGQMIDHWEHQATAEIIEALDALDGSPDARMAALIEISTSDQDAPYGGPMTEMAIRAWAQQDAMVAEAQARVDVARVRYVEQLMTGLGSLAPALHARVFYHAYVGGAGASTEDRRMVLTELVRALIAR